MSDHSATIEDFYRSFQRGDGETMAAFYHPEATFKDPVFSLRGSDVGDMWRMLCTGDNDLEIDFSNVHATNDGATALWEASYKFGPKRRPVENKIEARFTFRDDLINDHLDEFDLAAWCRQALGISGSLFGNSNWFQDKVRDQAAGQLRRFQERRSE
jgi:hypothetical protein